MGQYLKLFKTEADYEAVVGTENEPNVAHIVEDVVVKEKKELFVDLGLPSGTLWATMNVGANSETEIGNFYQYGKGARTYQETSGGTNYNGTENPLASSLDTATQVWGGDCHMPTTGQCAELTANTTIEYSVIIDGVKGIKFTASNGKYIFFPYGGLYQNGSKPSYSLTLACIWSSTPSSSSDKDWAYGLNNSDRSYSNRKLGYNIRAVKG